MAEIKFKRDTSFRKQFFVPDSFAHPAKMDAQLLIWIVENYTKEGEVILDPMAGSGTMMLACTLGRDVILVELEEKFCKMMRDNWEEVKMRPQLGYQMGNCQIIQGDARQLEGLVDKIVTSPPYVSGGHHDGVFRAWGGKLDTKSGCGQIATPKGGYGENPSNIGNLPYGNLIPQPRYDKVYYEAVKRMAEQEGNLPYGNIDSIITSPPYEGSDISQTHMTSNERGDPSNPNYRPSWKRKLGEGYAESKRPYHEVDSIITSPPYENQGQGQGNEYHPERMVGNETGLGRGYSEGKDNIGNLKSQSYLEAMLQVYQQCWKVLKPQGLMILVTKNFIRNKQVIRLDTDTIKLCEQAGFHYLERHYRKLPSQSFWRVIYHQRHPEVEQILNEDVLAFRKVLF